MSKENGVKGKVKIDEIFGVATIEFRKGYLPTCRYTVRFDLKTGNVKVDQLQQDVGCFAYEDEIKQAAIKQLLTNLKEKLDKMNKT